MSTTDPRQPFNDGPRAPQIGQPQYAPPHYAQAPLQPVPARSPNSGRANVLGILALSLLALQMILGTFTPLLYRLVNENFAVLTTGITVVNVLIMLAALGLAIGGVYQRGATRFRWAAVGSLVAAGLGLVGTILSLIGGWITSVLYW